MMLQGVAALVGSMQQRLTVRDHGLSSADLYVHCLCSTV